MTRRSRARQVALQVLFQDDLNPRNNPVRADALIQRRLRLPELIEFARDLVAGVRRNRAELDRVIAEAAVNWSLDRMPPTDRNVLRLGAYEILHSDTPDRVAIDEAIDLARQFGTAHSATFVNGILDRLMHDEGARQPRSVSLVEVPEEQKVPEPATRHYWLFQIMYDWYPRSWRIMVHMGLAAQDYPPGWLNEGPNIDDLSQMGRGDRIVAAFRAHRFAGYATLTSDFYRGGPSFQIRHRRTSEILPFGERFKCDWTVLPFDADPPYIKCHDLKGDGFDIDLIRARCVKQIDEETFFALKARLDAAGARRADAPDSELSTLHSQL